MQNIEQIEELLGRPEFAKARVYATGGDYRRTLVSEVVFDTFKCDPETGETYTTTGGNFVAILKQFRVDFYKPRDWESLEEQEGFFALNALLKDKSLEVKKEELEEEELNLWDHILELHRTGFVWNVYEIKTVKAYSFVDKSLVELLKGGQILPGHIYTTKSDTPFYEGQNPLVTDLGSEIYYRTDHSMSYQPDKDLRNITVVMPHLLVGELLEGEPDSLSEPKEIIYEEMVEIED